MNSFVHDQIGDSPFHHRPVNSWLWPWCVDFGPPIFPNQKYLQLECAFNMWALLPSLAFLSRHQNSLKTCMLSHFLHSYRSNTTNASSSSSSGACVPETEMPADAAKRERSIKNRAFGFFRYMFFSMSNKVEEVCLSTHMKMVRVKPLRLMAFRDLDSSMADDALHEVAD